jgi:hypothetical protein
MRVVATSTGPTPWAVGMHRISGTFLYTGTYIRYPAGYRIWLAGYPARYLILIIMNKPDISQIEEITVSIHKISKNVFLKLCKLEKLSIKVKTVKIGQ